METPNASPATPPSGPWCGYYVYSPGGTRHGQQMTLTFAGARLSGGGQDDVGVFDVNGSYARESGLVSWLKTYRGAHGVSYRGYFEKGSIYGGWRIDAECHGGFKIWPAPPDSIGNANVAAIAESLETVLTRHAKAKGLTLQQAFDELCDEAERQSMTPL